jgi:hypothetical protein
MRRVQSAYAVVSIHRVDQGIPGRGLTARQTNDFLSASTCLHPILAWELFHIDQLRSASGVL